MERQANAFKPVYYYYFDESTSISYYRRDIRTCVRCGDVHTRIAVKLHGIYKGVCAACVPGYLDEVRAHLDAMQANIPQE